jgi:hypothetical protein
MRGPWSRFSVGFCLTVAVTLVFNALNFYRVWFAPGCADRVLDAGVPFPVVTHGGFFTETLVRWRGILDNVAAVFFTESVAGQVPVRFMPLVACASPAGYADVANRERP